MIEEEEEGHTFPAEEKMHFSEIEDKYISLRRCPPDDPHGTELYSRDGRQQAVSQEVTKTEPSSDQVEEKCSSKHSSNDDVRPRPTASTKRYSERHPNEQYQTNANQYSAFTEPHHLRSIALNHEYHTEQQYVSDDTSTGLQWRQSSQRPQPHHSSSAAGIHPPNTKVLDSEITF